MGRTRPTPTSQLTHGDAGKDMASMSVSWGLLSSWRGCNKVSQTDTLMGKGTRNSAGKGGCSGSGRSNWRRGKKTETGGGEGGAWGTIVVTGGQLEQIWESRNLSLRKDDPALSSALCVRLCCHSTVCYGPWSRWNGNFSIFQIREEM